MDDKLIQKYILSNIKLYNYFIMRKNIEQFFQNSAKASPTNISKNNSHFYSCQDVRQKNISDAKSKKVINNKVPSFLGKKLDFNKKNKFINLSNPESPNYLGSQKNRSFDKITSANSWLPLSIQRKKVSPTKKNGILALEHSLTAQEYEKRSKKLQEMTKQLRYCKDLLKSKNTFFKNNHKNSQEISLDKLSKNLGLKDTIATNTSMTQKKQLSRFQFVFLKEIGHGKFGSVHLVLHKKTGFLCAMKIFKKCFILSSMMLKQLIQEIKLQSYLNHPNIVKIFACFDDVNYVYLLTQYVSGGNLHQFMQNTISQNKARRFLKNICQAVCQLHANNIIHRDLKAENLVLQSGVVKICDFGWSSFSQQNMKQTCCGTPVYLAPEIILGDKYNNKVDVWAIGILAYEMLIKQLPFSIKHQQDLMNILTKDICFPEQIGDDAKQFIRIALCKKPQNRAKAQDLLKSPFISNLKNNLPKELFY